MKLTLTFSIALIMSSGADSLIFPTNTVEALPSFSGTAAGVVCNKSSLRIQLVKRIEQQKQETDVKELTAEVVLSCA